MRSLVIPAFVAGLIVAAPLALAAQQATGTVKSIDMNAMTLTLSDGTTYRLPANFKDPGLKPGERVQVSWNMQNGQHDATSVTIAK
jgi:Protein of unknown function (DUF1344)